MDALQSIGNFFSSPGGKGLESLASIGATGAGLAGNLATEHARNQELNYLKQQQGALADPTKLASEVAAATQPLNRSLVQSVGNQVSGTLAEQGLAEAPGIQATVLSQALAPYEQQNQQTALSLVLQRLGLPLSYAQTLLSGLPPNTNLAPLMALLGRPGTTPTGPQPILNYAPATRDWTANLPGITDVTPPDTNSWIPDWLLSAPPEAPAFGG
jgi:hypothetical protein